MVAVNDQGLDFAWSHPPASLIRSLGFRYVSRYLCWLEADTVGKVATRAEVQADLAAGVDVFLNWEWAATDQLGGANYGRIHATEAVRQAIALGYPRGATIYYSADFDEAPSQVGTVAAYNAAAKPITNAAGYRHGVYGDYYVLGRLFNAKLIDDGWQAYAWSGGQWDNRASLRQVQNGYPFRGYSVDRNICVGPAYSWLKPYKAGAPASVPKPAPVPTVQSGDKMLILAQDGVGGPVYVGDGVTRRWLKNPQQLSDLTFWIGEAKVPAYAGGAVQVFDPGTVEDVLGVLVGLAPTQPAGPAPVK